MFFVRKGDDMIKRKFQPVFTCKWKTSNSFCEDEIGSEMASVDKGEMGWDRKSLLGF